MKKTLLIFIILIMAFMLVGCKKKTYEILYELDGGIHSSESVPATYTSESEEIILPIPTKEGFIFEGWYSSLTSDTEVKSIIKGSKGDKVFYAKWKEIDISINKTKTLTANELWLMEESKRNVTFNNNLISVDDPESLAIFNTKPIKITNFYQLVMSFNVLDLDEARVQFMVSIGNENQMSDWMTMGYWENNNHQSVTSQNNDFASVSIDTLTNKNVNDNTFIAVKFVVTPNGSTPKIKNISITTKPTKTTKVAFNDTNLKEITLDVPKINQMSIPTIGNVICSPTSLAMILQYYEKDVTATSVADIVYDRRWKAYGNWTLNASYAAEHDLNGRVEFVNDTSVLRDYILAGVPLALSIKTTSMTELINSPQAYPAGHLIVIVGFKKVEDTWYAVVNDPAVYNDNDVRREYKLEQLANVMSGYIYVVTTKDLN